tara:strand:+ start:2522 stop:2977 length:456 start_codon:yes stop_codon:yes gene_type:complete
MKINEKNIDSIVLSYLEVCEYAKSKRQYEVEAFDRVSDRFFDLLNEYTLENENLLELNKTNLKDIGNKLTKVINLFELEYEGKGSVRIEARDYLRRFFKEVCRKNEENGKKNLYKIYSKNKSEIDNVLKNSAGTNYKNFDEFLWDFGIGEN